MTEWRGRLTADCVTKYMPCGFILHMPDLGSRVSFRNKVVLYCGRFEVLKYPASWKTPTGYGLEVEYYQ